MNELLTKLTNLEYELFSVLIPGFVVGLFVILWWNALGGLAPLWTSNLVPELTVDTARKIVDSLNVPSGAGVGIVAFAICYFAGHILLWIARAGGSTKPQGLKGWQRICRSLIFRIPKPENNYHPKLEELYNKVQAKFSPDGTPLDWRQFYPVVKLFLSEYVRSSLVATYQNKYTFHRSIAAAAALLFWFCILSLIGAWFSPICVELLSYVSLSVLAAAGVWIVWGFSASYIYHWEMFGNSVITEAYSYIFGPPPHESSKK